MDAKMRNPFASLQIASHDKLHTVSTRTKCPECKVSRKYFCYTCHIPMPEIADNLPQIKLPLRVDIIKHQLEVDGKSTAVHARLLAPDHVTIYTYPDMPQYENKDQILLVYPYKDAVSLEDLVKQMSASKVIPKLELHEMDQTSIQCECHNGAPPCQTDIQSCLNEQPSTKTSFSYFQGDLDSAIKETCGCSHQFESGHNSRSGLDLTASKLTTCGECHHHHRAVRHTSQNPQTGSLKTDSRSIALKLKSSGKSCPYTVAGDLSGSGLTTESHCCHQHAQSSPSDTHTTVSGLTTESHCCHQKAQSNPSDTHTTVSGLTAESYCCHQAQNSPPDTHTTVSRITAESHCCHQNAQNSPPDTHTTVTLGFDGDDRDGQECRTKKVKRDLVEGPFERVIFIDSTWSQSRGISRDERLSGIKRVIIQDRLTTFWRSQLHKPPTYLATIEAIYYFLIDYHRIVLGKQPNGQYDNLLFLYSFMHGLVHKTKEEREILCVQEGKI